jgi:hypothetical protein
MDYRINKVGSKLKSLKVAAKLVANIINWGAVTYINRLKVLLQLILIRSGRRSNRVVGAYENFEYQTQQEVMELNSLAKFNLPVGGKLKILLVDHERAVGISGIISQIALNLYKALSEIEFVEVDLQTRPSTGYDVIHHFIYTMAAPTTASATTAMVTHVDSRSKLVKVKSLLNNEVGAICMSQHTKEFINFELDNLFADNLHVVSPIPMIGEIKRKIRLAYVSNSYSDGRKRESLLIEFLTKVDPEWLQISLMGIGLEAVHEALFDNSIETVYTNYFDITKYNELLRSCDYFIYLGLDEGAISILDAVAAGVKVITTNQGFHREIKSSRVNFVESADDFRNILNGEISEKIAQRNGSRYGQWNNFASQHLQIWRRMLDGEA